MTTIFTVRVLYTWRWWQIRYLTTSSWMGVAPIWMTSSWMGVAPIWTTTSLILICHRRQVRTALNSMYYKYSLSACFQIGLLVCCQILFMPTPCTHFVGFIRVSSLSWSFVMSRGLKYGNFYIIWHTFEAKIQIRNLRLTRLKFSQKCCENKPFGDEVLSMIFISWKV